MGAHALLLATLVAAAGPAPAPPAAPPVAAPSTPAAAEEQPARYPTEPAAPAAPESPPETKLPKEAPEETAARPEDDVALLATLRELLDPDSVAIRQRAATRLGELGDPRSIGPLVFALRDSRAEVRAAAAVGLGSYRRPRAELALTRVVEREGEQLAVRVAAVRALARHKTPTAGESLYRAYTDDRAPLELRRAAEDALATSFPDLLRRRGTVEVIEREGRLVAIPAGALLGSYALGAVGALGVNEDTAVPVGIVGGLVIGGATAYLLTEQEELTLAQGTWFASAGGWGIVEGLLIGHVIAGPGGDGRVRTTAGLLGEVTGVGGSLLTLRQLKLGADEVMAVNLAGTAGAAGGLGLAMLGDLGSRPHAALTAGGAAVGLVVSGLTVGGMESTTEDEAFTALATFHGAVLGTLAATTADLQDERSLGATLLGASLGYGAAALSAPIVETTQDQNALLFAVPTFGYFAGGSIPALANEESGRVSSAGAIAGGFAGAAGAVLLRDRLSLEKADAAFVLFTAAYGLWQLTGWGAWLQAEDLITPTQMGGMAAAGVGFGGLAGIALARTVDASVLDTVALLSGAFWGVWFTGFTGFLVDADGQDLILSMLLASDAGLAVGGALIAAGVDSGHLGFASLGGVTGAAIFSLGGALTTTDGDAIVAANLAGSAIGLAAGALLAGPILGDRSSGAGGGLELGEWQLRPGTGFAQPLRHGEVGAPLVTLGFEPKP